jgi:hypothetical protein
LNRDYGEKEGQFIITVALRYKALNRDYGEKEGSIRKTLALKNGRLNRDYGEKEGNYSFSGNFGWVCGEL